MLWPNGALKTMPESCPHRSKEQMVLKISEGSRLQWSRTSTVMSRILIVCTVLKIKFTTVSFAYATISANCHPLRGRWSHVKTIPGTREDCVTTTDQESFAQTNMQSVIDMCPCAGCSYVIEEDNYTHVEAYRGVWNSCRGLAAAFICFSPCMHPLERELFTVGSDGGVHPLMANSARTLSKELWIHIILNCMWSPLTEE